MVLAVVSFSFTQFRPFRTAAFNKQPGQAEIEVSDRSQLRNLLRTNRMVEQGDSSNYFGSNPKAMPTFEEVMKQGKSGGDPKLAKLVHAVPAENMEKLDKAADQTNFGRRQSNTNPEFVVGR